MAKEKSTSALNSRMVTLIAVLIALICVLTIVVRIPLAPTRGYMNLSNVGIYWCSFTFGPWISMIAGGIGTGIADAVMGYPQWTIPSMIIHGSQGLIAGLIARAGGFKLKWMLLGWAIASVVDCFGYFGATIWMYGWGPAIVDFPGQWIQQIVALILGIPLVYAVKKAYPPISQLGKTQKWEES